MTGSDGETTGSSATGPDGPGRQRSGRRPLRIALLIVVSFLVLLGGGVGWIYFKLNGNITTFGADGLSDNRPEGNAAGQNVLVIGSDSRSGDNSRLGGGSGDVGRSDTALLLHVYSDGKHAVGVSIPRDTLVDIPPCRLPDGSWTSTRRNAMFNSAFSVGETAQGNPACTQNTVERLTGLRMDHTVVIDFEGFSRMTSAVGGVQVCVPQDVYERDLSPSRTTRGKRIFSKGVQTVSGQKALDYVRIRHGIGDGSDIGRIQRQQAFISGLFKKVKSRGFDPTTLYPLADAATKSMTVDPGLGSAKKLMSFAMSLKSIDLHNTKFITIPWRYQGERVAVVQPDADQLWADIRADRTIDGKRAGGKKDEAPATPSATPTVSGAGISVTVYNGTTTPGLAARAADTLSSHGFTVTGTTNAETQDHATTVVGYGPGERNRARTVAQLFPGAGLRPTTTPGISLTLGQTYLTEPSPDASAPSTSPSKLDKDARSADDDPCSNLSYG
ncbi:LytR family transcriptional regulator [Streptomyces sp. SID8382]|uniref:LCP family protein n=1 Tax=Streptomyces malaysiensis TaxID=92644 RepID=UPI000C2BA890|nr:MULTISPECIES: LCP family protein [unclassified Streptomyces]AUA15817.1 Putative transcriptional regulator YwtF [Streptomyces sp. M56]MYX60297.1 LytR family transcriptional regulator [Streptomyces sp. SID8382]